MRQIRNSAKALIIKDGKMVAIKIRDAGEEWYILCPVVVKKQKKRQMKLFAVKYQRN